jgi:putative adenylate-forming enzyme
MGGEAVNRLLSLLWHYATTRRNARRWRNREELEAWQDLKVRRHLAWVLPRSTFYRRLYADRPVENWRDFPIISKTEMMNHFDELNTAGVSRDTAMAGALAAERSRDFSSTIGDVTVGLSSGTSGNRGLFLTRPAEQMAWAGTLLAKVLPGSLSAGHRAALFLRANSNLYRSVRNRWLSFEFFDLLEPLPQLSRRLENFHPTLLVGPPSLLRLLAGARRDGRLRIQPERVVSVAEVLEPQDARFLATQFASPIHQIYQATEGFLGATCSHGVVHLNEDIVVVQKEWLDSTRRKFVPIITDFRRTTQPILRYRLNDILTERAGRCPCGSPFQALDAIEGRSDDLLAFPSTEGGGMVNVFPDFIRRSVVTADENISEYKVVQDPCGRLRVSIAVTPASMDRAEDRVRTSLVSLCDELRCEVPEISFAPFEDRPPHTKLRRVERHRDLSGENAPPTPDSST